MAPNLPPRHRRKLARLFRRLRINPRPRLDVQDHRDMVANSNVCCARTGSCGGEYVFCAHGDLAGCAGY